MPEKPAHQVPVGLRQCQRDSHMWHGIHASNEVHLDGGCISIRNFAARNLKRLSGSTDVAVALSETVASLVGTEKTVSV